MTRPVEAIYPGLPPRPDPATGEPFPPPARAWRGYAGSEISPEDDKARETRLSYKPKPPPGRGLVIVWQSESKHGKVYRFIGSLLVVIVGMSVITAVRGLGALWWASHWQIWAILVVGTLLMTAPFTFITLSAGPDWFQWIYRRYGGLFGRKKFIDLYDLRKIDVTPGVVTYELLLADANDSIGLPLSEWQCDRRMWDLVYNGILHSAAQGAKVNPSARVVLELDDALKDCRTPSGKQTSDDER